MEKKFTERRKLPELRKKRSEEKKQWFEKPTKLRGSPGANMPKNQKKEQIPQIARITTVCAYVYVLHPKQIPNPDGTERSCATNRNYYGFYWWMSS